MTTLERSGKLMKKVCLECGGPIVDRRTRGGREPNFCSTEHRQKWNNRRRDRGAVLYDIYMSGRADRAKQGSITTMAQASVHWRENDKKRRGGRRSWINEDDYTIDYLTKALTVE